MDIDIIVVNYKRYDLTYRFLDSFLYFFPKSDYTLTVVDNETSSGLEALQLSLDAYKNIKYLSSEENLGYAKAVNWAASETQSKYIGIFNNDVSFLNYDCIDRCIEFLEENPDVGVVGPKQLDSKGRLTHAGIIGSGDSPRHRAWLQPDSGEYNSPEEVVTVIGAAMIVRRSAWNAIMEDPIYRRHWPDALGAMPEHFLYYEETALNYMMPRFGYKVYYLGDAVCSHEWHQTIKEHGDMNAFEESRELFRSLLDDMEILHD